MQTMPPMALSISLRTRATSAPVMLSDSIPFFGGARSLPTTGWVQSGADWSVARGRDDWMGSSVVELRETERKHWFALAVVPSAPSRRRARRHSLGSETLHWHARDRNNC